MVLGGDAALGKVGVEDASGSDEFTFAARGEWFRYDGVTSVVVQDQEVFAIVGRGDGKTPGLVSAHLSWKLDCL